jgi:PAS domain S-box-containing protein
VPKPTLFQLFRLNRAPLALAGISFLVILIGMSWLGVDVANQIERESESRTDNAQWALSQIEVELLYMMLATSSALDNQGTLDNVRLRYDILYSRLESLRVGQVFGGLRETPKYVEHIARLNTFMADELSYFDGPDEGLRNRLPTLYENSATVVGDARVVALTGVKVIAEASDKRRREVTKTLALAGGLTAVMITFLVALLVMLLRQFRFNRMRSAENLATLSRLDAVVSTALEALVTIDAHGRIIDFNEAACQTFGYSREEAVGADMAELVMADPGPRALFQPGKAPETDGQGRFRIMARHKDGRIIPAEVSISRMTLGDETEYVAFLRDLSTQLAAEQALVTARDEALAGEKAKADLLVVMSHEIRTPLNGMIGTIELLDSTELQPNQREYLRIMEASGKLLMHHVNDVLDIARLDSGKAPLLAGPVDLVALVRDVLENQTPASQANGNKLVFSAPADGRSMVECDGAQLRRVLLNLVGNAVKFTSNGQISVEIEHKGAKGPTEIRVRDTGIGISGPDLDRIFDDFVTLDASYARRASGTGLGLGIVKRIVMQMGGTLEVDSQKGEGSTFRVILPLRILEDGKGVQPNRTEVPPVPAISQNLATLVVEDNEFNRVIVRKMLQNEGYDVVEARDGLEGIALAEARKFDVILMDISMPKIDGLQAAQTILSGKGASRQTPIVAMTAHALAEETARFRAGGMVAVLVKPFSREQLRSVLHDALAGHGGLAMPPGVDGPLLDRDVLEDLARDLGPSKARTLVQAFRVEATTTVSKITDTTAISPADRNLRRELHRLAGSAGIFGARRLQKALSEVETAWKTGAVEKAGAGLAGLHEIWLATDRALQEEAALAQPSSFR